MNKKLYFLLCSFFTFSAIAQNVIEVQAGNGDMTARLQEAINRAATYKESPVIIKLQNADYNIFRKSSSPQIYHVSNTTSEIENPDPTKNIGLWLKGLKNVVIDGKGARFVTHGKMTTFVIDQCQNITLKNFTVTAADPTVAELTVTEVGDRHMTVRTHPQSLYTIENGNFAFVGEGWKLSGGIAQIYDPERDITWRSWSPLSGLRDVQELKPGLLRFVYDKRPEARSGIIFQMRDGIRDQVCGFIQYSKDITLEDIHFAFLGNFGLVGQVSENITYRHLTFEPEAGSGRTCAGFADFVQMSGCKGKIEIENSRFSGAHDDPINIHGTHLAVTGMVASDQVALTYKHPQTYGFQSFFPGNEIEFIDSRSLLPLASYKVKKAEMKNEREIILTLDKTIDPEIREATGLVVENVTYTPEVVIRNNFFVRISTRGILVTTRRKVLIENNTFFRTQMSGILIADDAQSWFESGMVRDVTIRDNRFMECAAPVISISPENDRYMGAVHKNITIANNRFRLQGTNAISAKSTDGLHIKNNLFETQETTEIKELVKTHACNRVTLTGNSVQKSKFY